MQMLWVYDYYKYCNSFSENLTYMYVDYKHQIMTSKDSLLKTEMLLKLKK